MYVNAWRLGQRLFMPPYGEPHGNVCVSKVGVVGSGWRPVTLHALSSVCEGHDKVTSVSSGVENVPRPSDTNTSVEQVSCSCPLIGHEAKYCRFLLFYNSGEEQILCSFSSLREDIKNLRERERERGISSSSSSLECKQL